jgi:uncharacterized membrane protein YqhA
MKLASLLAPSRVLQIACTLALVALALIVWSLLDPRPIPVILAMSVAQGLGTLSFAAFLFVVVRDLRTGQRKERESPTPH